MTKSDCTGECSTCSPSANLWMMPLSGSLSFPGTRCLITHSLTLFIFSGKNTMPMNTNRISPKTSPTQNALVSMMSTHWLFGAKLVSCPRLSSTNARMAIPSNRCSTIIVANEAEIGTFSFFRSSTARKRSPARAG